MSCNHTNSKGLLAGAVLGGLLVGGCVVFLNSKSGRKIKNDISENYENLGNKIEQFVSDLNEGVKNQVKSKVDNWSEKAQNTMASVKEEISEVVDLESKNFAHGVITGGVLGVLLSVGGTIMYKSCFEKETNFVQNIGCQASKIKKMINDTLETVDARTKPLIAECRDGHPINDVLDFAITGMKLWQAMKHK